MSKFCGGCGSALVPDIRFCESCGRPVAPPASATPAPPQPAPAFTAPPTSKRPFVVAGIVLGALVVLGVCVSVLQVTLFSPTATVKAFFGDLADGDGTSAGRRLDGVPSTGGTGYVVSRELLSDKVLSSKSYVAPTDVEVSEVSGGDDDHKRVKVSYRLDGQQKTATLSLDRSERRHLLFFRTWRIDDGTTTLSLPVGVPYQVNGVALKEPKQSPAGGTDAVTMQTLAAFPGHYEVGIADNPLLSGEPKDATLALGGQPAQLTLAPTIKPAARAEVTKQVNAYLDDCAKQTVVQPPNCPFNAYAGADARNVKWSVVTYPKVTFKQAPGGSVYVETAEGDTGNATVSYETKDYFTGSYTSQTSTSTITVGGPVVVKDGKVKWMSPKDFAEQNKGGD